MNPTKVQIEDRVYPINTDFRVAIKCDSVARDSKITDIERSLAIIYLLYGEKGLNAIDDYNNLIKLGIKYLTLGKETEKSNDEPDMDFVQDEGYIKSSFKYDYQYDPYELEYLHWYDFYNDLQNLSYSEFGSCCVLSRVRALRSYDTSKIKDAKEKQKVEKAKQQMALKKKPKKLTNKQMESIERFNELAGIK